MQAEMWLARMINDGVLADIVRFNSVINAFAQKDDGESAASWLSRMINEGLLPDIAHCATHCVRRSARDKRAWETSN